MDPVDERQIRDLDSRLERLEREHNRSPVRGTTGGGGGEVEFDTVNVLPALPVVQTILFLESVDAAALPTVVPKPDAKDTYWWAGPNDVRWHPIAGKIVDIAGDPGDMSEV